MQTANQSWKKSPCDSGAPSRVDRAVQQHVPHARLPGWNRVPQLNWQFRELERLAGQLSRSDAVCALLL